MTWTILRPTAFYDNLTPDIAGKLFATCFKMSMHGAPLQMVGVSDIGSVAAEVESGGVSRPCALAGW